MGASLSAGAAARTVQGSAGPPVLSQYAFSSAQAESLAVALVSIAASDGLMSDNFWVKPDQPAESDTAGPQLPVAAFTPQPAALSRARSALSAGFCCSAIVSSSFSFQVGACTTNVSVSCTLWMSTGAVNPICGKFEVKKRCCPGPA